MHFSKNVPWLCLLLVLAVRPIPSSISSSNLTDVERLRNALIAQESNGDATVLNTSGSGAMGLAQVMPENLPSWSKEALGRVVSEREFLANPELQIQIIDHRLRLYWQEEIEKTGGNERSAVRRIAARWYSGNPDWQDSTTPQFWNGNEYPSIAEYSDRVWQKFNRQGE